MGVVVCLAGAAYATGGEPPARSAPVSTNLSGVTVTAPQTPSPLVNPASQFVRTRLPQSQLSEQYPRFRDPVCVKVIGLPQEFNAFVAKRIVELAQEVKAPVAKASDCLPNVHVIFTPQPQAQISDIAKHREILIGFHFPSQSEKLTTMSRPIQSWYVTRVRDKDRISWLEIDNNTPACPPEIYTGPACERPPGRAGSRLGNDMSAEVVHSLIIADANRVAGAKIDVIADYIAVLALAKWQSLEKCSRSVPTILNLMADGCDAEDRPDAATPGDLALLSGLYTVDPRESGVQQRMSIAGWLQTALKTTPGKDAR